MSVKKFDPKSEAQNMKEWIENTNNRRIFLTDAKSEMEASLSKLTPTLSLTLENYATWEGISAERMLLENDTAGREHLQRCYRYLTWSRRIRLAFLDVKRGQKVVFVTEFALLLAHAIAIRDDAFADFLGIRLIKSLAEKDKRFVGWDNNPAEPFIAKLYAKWRGTSVEKLFEGMPTIRAYDSIFNSWSDTRLVAEALIDACDYHVSRNESGNEDPEFASSPYRWFPVEILAVLRLRQDEGLENIIPNHPIMKSMFCDPPIHNITENDQLLDQIIQKVRAELPVGDPW